MKWALVFTLTLPSPQRAPDRWFALDKWRHFVASAVVQSVGYGFASGTNGHRESLRIGAAATAVVGVAKEVADRARGGPFSVRDLVWDAAGAGAAAAALHAVR
jgi:uncharacterized protein YfiM (DUF2279 family)